MRILLFGTTYVDTLEKRAIQNMWYKMRARNPCCDALIVDCNSPLLPTVPSDVWYYTFADNVGHLSKGGKDGWGRAFTYGLQYAVDEKYDYVLHVECDSLCKLDIVSLVEEIALSGDSVASIHVSSMMAWAETGLMLFDVEWLRDTAFVARYDWANRKKYPEPECVVRDLCGKDLTIMPWHGMRDDFHELTEDNVEERKLDWLTHAPLPVMQKFFA